jgi:two-component system, OmpR family, sensor kinase
MMTTMTTRETTTTTMGEGAGPPHRRISLLQSSVSVRTRIAAAVALLGALALASSGLMVYVLGVERVHDTIRVAVDQELAELEEFEENGRDLETGERFDSVDRLIEEFLERNVPGHSELMVGVWGGEVKISSASSRSGLREDPDFLGAVLPKVPDGGSGRVDTPWGEVYYEVLPVRDAQRNGAFAVAYFVDDELQTIRQIVRSYAVVAALALLVVTAAAAWLAGRLLAPVRTLRETAEEIGETDLSRRIPVSGNDDITALTHTVNAMLGRLEQAFAGQRAFLDDAGHELRTPLTILQGHLELLDASDPDDVDRTRDLLLDEVDRMSRLVEDMILLTKTDRPGFLSTGAVAVDDLVAAVAEKVRGLGDRAWQVESSATGTAELDEQRVTQALLQLAHNAVKHTSPSDTVAVGSADHGESVRLWVRDTGPGVPDEEKAPIFRRFSRGADEANPDGVGLGLSIVAAIVAAHGGTVHVEDASPGGGAPRGARFVITLPRSRKEHAWPAS